MTSLTERISDDINRLSTIAGEILMDIESRLKKASQFGDGNLNTSISVFEEKYQEWYSEALFLVDSLLPIRKEEFIGLYQGINKVDFECFPNIQEWLLFKRSKGYYNTVDTFGFVAGRFTSQLGIFKSAVRSLNSSLFNIKQLVAADLFDNELDTARELLEKGFIRPAGAVAGVVIETHLSYVCANHGIEVTKMNPTIGDYNDLLKKCGVYEVSQSRKIQAMADIRNKCTHKKDKEPTKDEVDELISGADKIIKIVS